MIIQIVFNGITQQLTTDETPNATIIIDQTPSATIRI